MEEERTPVLGPRGEETLPYAEPGEGAAAVRAAKARAEEALGDMVAALEHMGQAQAAALASRVALTLDLLCP